MLILSSRLHAGLPSGLVSGFHTQTLCACCSAVHATCTAPLMIPNLLILIIFGKECKLLAITLYHGINYDHIINISLLCNAVNTLQDDTCLTLLNVIMCLVKDIIP
jgi:hypothetical protein